ncbi:IS5 family transposase [Xylanimonas ulmi]|uniref:IS5 family transposase n=1 Tax=Xylanimonas ulmi TaxID=228973 RepID=UPI0013EED029|nr:IS5 family transposase [Xylanibacterium ulmi]
MPGHDAHATDGRRHGPACRCWSRGSVPCELIPRRPYPSDLTDTAWARIAALVVPTPTRGGRPCCEHRWREYVNALLLIVATGIPWRSLPHDFAVTWSATHKHFSRWTKKQLWGQMLTILRAEDRVHDGRDQEPTAAVVDSSSVKSTPAPGERGFDGAKKVDGIKRHILVDTAGRLLAAHVTAANVQDRAAFADLLTKNPCPSVTHVWADKGYTGQAPATAAAAAGIELEIVSGPKPVGGFVVQPRRWVVERTNGWINRHRRLVRQYEATLTAHEALAILSQIRLLLRRPDRHG